MRTCYPLAADTMGSEEIEAAKAVLDSRRLTMGERVRVFEQALAEWTGAPHVVMVNSGSSANLLMVDALLRRCGRTPPLRPGDEVLVPGLSWPTTVWPLGQLGLVPVFADVHLDTLAMDLDSARAALSPRTRAMMLIHVLGRVPPMEAYTAFCQEHGLTLLEDACEGLGGHHAGHHAGTFGLMGSFSFYYSHHISTIEGGAVVTHDGALADDLRSLRAHGWIRDRSDRHTWEQRHPDFDPRFLFVTSGYNVRPMELQAAIGLVQLARLDGMLAAREDLARRVTRRIAHLPWLRLLGSETLPPEGSPVKRYHRSHSWMMLPFLVDERAPFGAEAVKARLEEAGVETRPIIAGNLARHPGVERFTTRTASSLATCERLFARGFMIGCHPNPGAEALQTLEAGLESLDSLMP